MIEPKPAKFRPVRLVLALVGVGLVLLATVAWLNRRPLAREALVGWLRNKGIASEAEVQAIGPTTFTARLRIGDPRNPDFAAERAEVRYRMRLSGLEVVSVKLTKPVLRAGFRQGRFGMGSLDPLVQEFMRRPPRPEAAKPRIEVDDGVLVLATDYGPVRLTADALVNDGQLMSLSAVSAPARLRSADFDLAIGASRLTMVRRAGQFEANLDAPLTSAAMAGAQARDARLKVKLDAPYPDLVRRRGDGALAVQAQLSSKRLGVGGRAFASSTASASFTGRVSGWIQDLAVAGRAVGDIRAEGGEIDGSRLGVLRAAAASDDLSWTRKGGDRVTATVRANAGLEDARAGDLRLAALTATAQGPVRAGPAGIEADLRGALVGRGGWTGLGAPTASDAADLAAIKRAARSFRLAAPAVSLRVKDGGATVALPQPARLVPDSGGAVELARRPGAPVFGPDGGAFRLRVAGGGLPNADADVAKLELVNGGVSASGRLQVKASLGPLQGGELDAAGRLRAQDGGLAFTAERCVTAKAALLDFGANDVEGVSGRLCPQSGPMLRVSNGGWRLVGRAEGVSASAPFAQARVAGGAGPLTASGVGDRMTAQARISAARVEDTAPQQRFSPLAMTGTANLREFIWRADLDFRQPGAGVIGRALVTHDGRLGLGVAVIESADLQFAEGGLQPVQLSPLAAALGSPVVGSAHFKGRFDWTPQGATSSGALSIPRLDFESPAGRVDGLKGEFEFASLAPLKAAAGQQFSVDRVQAVVPLEHLKASFEVADNVLKVQGGEAEVGGGRVRVESLEVPLVEGATTRGVLQFEGVQLHDLVEASPFGDKVELDARVSGRVPFEATGNRVRIPGGELKAIQPGRLSIDRTALTGIQGAGGPEAPGGASAGADPNSTFTDFAYQAMENLAFDQLEATIVSRDDGRLGVLFHIVGRHDPPQRQQIKLTLMDLIRKRFLGRPLPLPSGTGVNLTLDTSLNLDDLLADYADYQRLHGSGTVQP